ncbi:zn-dependent oxidoreductase, NADph:quinone reductase [Halogeometricum pallidum JCM 14848]|uniref:Zn-dependent oxidoreductase, NADph:quinone reductase n=1 Tax=Halogeometricum pallidum JCM 14848 TaxID=1227487 RepID=M0DLR2_HALPD|nr:NADPH:quinone reductase [Halogeometricum pallidum]ELZ35074.1 zn-dependent oxidoreductase, NADph:quinone reductase [Halogeometricum pallidum JCM 14848]
MRAVRFHEHGGPDVLTVDDVDEPEPGHGEVVVEVGAAGVNPVDTYFREGAYPVPSLPFVPGSDLAGTVVSVGDDVERFSLGDRVFGTGLGNGRSGTYAEQVAAPVDSLAHLSDDAELTDAAALALVGTTAWRALVHHAGVEPAERVLVHGGSGGVGHVAVQLARAMGARPLATASPGHHDALRDLGAESAFDYRRDDLAAAISEAGAPDVVLDTHMDRYLQLNANVAADGARIVGIGNDTAEGGFDDIGVTKSKELRYQFMSMFNTPDPSAVLAHLNELLVRGDVEPVVHDTYALEEADDAQRAVLNDSFLGKLVLVP